MTAPVDQRPEQYRSSVHRLVHKRPGLFAPFGVHEWLKSPYGYYRDCIKWPVPGRWVHAVPRNPKFPNVPTLVLGGDLDSLTSPEGARATARAFPNSTYVAVANGTHVTALVDFNQCTSRIVRRFVRLAETGDTSCAADYHENRLVNRFVRTAEKTGWAGSRRRTARITAATAADVMARWLSMYSRHGVGLQGGRFTTQGGHFTSDRPVVRWKLREVKWVSDVSVSGTMEWHRLSGLVRARLRVRGDGAIPGRLLLRWDDLERRATAFAAGRLGGERVRLHFPAP